MCNAWNHSEACECGFGPPYTRDAAGFFDHHFTGLGGKNLSSAGPRTRGLSVLLDDDRLTTQLASTFLWQSYLGSSASRWAIRPPKVGAPGKGVVTYIVQHGKRWPRHDLLVFDPHLPPGKIVEGYVEVKPEELRRGWPSYHETCLAGASVPKWLSGFSIKDVPEIAIEAMHAQRHFFVAMRPPRIVRTARTRRVSPRIPSPALGVSLQAGGGPLSTAGMVATDSEGRQGVTTALHAVQGHRNGVFVRGTPGNIRVVDTITDSCFIEIANARLPRVRTCQGPLTGLTPRRWEEVWFDGVTSGKTTTYVEGWTLELPFCGPGIQSRIITPAVTDPGDSGAALVSSDGHILGFALYRTGFNARSPHSAWIWADSVFSALHLH